MKENNKNELTYEGKYETSVDGIYGWFDISKDLYEAYVNGSFKGLMLEVRVKPLNPPKEQEETASPFKWLLDKGYSDLVLSNPTKKPYVYVSEVLLQWQSSQQSAAVETLQQKVNQQSQEINLLRDALTKIMEVTGTSTLQYQIANNALNKQ